MAKPVTPPSVHDLRRNLIQVTGKDSKWFSVARTCASSGAVRRFRGYHLSAEQIESECGVGFRKDYSVDNRRDRRAARANPTYRSALDINLGTAWEKKFVAWFVAQAKASPEFARAFREIIGVRADGRAARYAAETNWREELYPEGNPHEWHVHISVRRDYHDADLWAMIKPFFGLTNAPPPDPVEPPPPEDEDDGALEEMVETLEAKNAALTQDLADCEAELQAAEDKLRTVALATKDYAPA